MHSKKELDMMSSIMEEVICRINPANSDLFAGLIWRIVSHSRNERVMKSKQGKVPNPSRLGTAVIAEIQINLPCTRTPTSPSDVVPYLTL